MADPETPSSPSVIPPPDEQATAPVAQAAPNAAEQLPKELDPHAKVCGNCRLFTAVAREGDVWKGDCKLMPDRAMFPATAPICNKFLARAAPVPRALPREPARAERRPPQIAPVVRKPDVPLPELENMTREELKAIVREALEESTPVRLAQRWEGGTVLIKPGNPELQSKELPVDALFHKVVMLRDRLRTLEQKINANAKLSDAEKVEMQQYITRCYGSLTTFNVLFADKDEGFVGEKGKGE